MDIRGGTVLAGISKYCSYIINDCHVIRAEFEWSIFQAFLQSMHKVCESAVLNLLIRPILGRIVVASVKLKQLHTIVVLPYPIHDIC